MTALQPTAAPRRSGRLAWVIAADFAVLALAAALALHGALRTDLVVALGSFAVLAALFDMGRRLVLVARSGALWRVVRVAALVVVALGGVVWVAERFGSRVALLIVVAFVALALVADWLVAVIERAGDDATPWQQLAASEEAAPGGRWPAERRAAVRRAGGAVIGVVLLGVIGLESYNVVQNRFGLYGWRGTLIGLLVLAGLVSLIAGPLLLAAQAGARRDRELRDRARDRQAVAAHLHDSVLQTLALIQRNATDSDKVVQLARQQERGLRSWLAGREEESSATLAAALRAAVNEVEDESGVRIDCVVAGDLPVDERTTALVLAAREALRNATRHAPGVPVRVFLEVDADGAALFVRDTGQGFDPELVDPERRGIRDAIVGRMRHAGGTAVIDSGAGGTEVVLRLPRRGGWS